MIFGMGIIRALKNNTILKASTIVLSITLVTKAIGYAEKVTVAYFWGTDFRADTYHAVFSILVGIAILFREILEPGLLNRLVRAKSTSGEMGSWQTFISVFWLVGIVGAVLSCLLIADGTLPVHIFLSGFRGDRLTLAGHFFQVGGIALFFLILSTVTNTYWLTYKKFAAIAFSDLAFKGTIVLVLLLLGNACGVYATVIGLVVGAICKFLIQTRRLSPYIFLHRLTLDRKCLSAVLLLSWPLLIGNLFSLAGNIVSNTFASYLGEGVISALSFAKKIIDLPVVLLPYTLSVVVFPFFSQMSVEKDTQRLNELFTSTIRYIVLLFLPLTIYIAVVPTDMVRLIFERGAFDSLSTELTASVLSVYNVGTTAFALETVLVVFLFAKEKIRLVVWLGVISVLLDIAFVGLTIGRLGYLAIAWGMVVSKWVKVLALLYLNRNSIPRATRRHAGEIGTVLLAMVVFAGLLIGCKNFFIQSAASGISLAARLLIAALFPFATYVLILVKTNIIRLKYGK